MKKKLVLLLVLVMTVSMLGACSSYSDRNAMDYGAYVQSLLDLDYKGITDKYLELVDDTKENAESFYGTTMQYWMYQLADLYQVYVDGDEGLYNDMLALTESIFAKVKYEVADAVKTDDYYTVEVTLYPMLFTEMTRDEVQAYQDQFNTQAANGEFGDYGNNDADTLRGEIEYGNQVISILEKYVSQIEYDKAVSKIVKITKDEDGLYGISDEDYADLEGYLLR